MLRVGWSQHQTYGAAVDPHFFVLQVKIKSFSQKTQLAEQKED